MKLFAKISAVGLPVVLGAIVCCSPAVAQSPVTPIIVDTTLPIIVNAVKPKPSGLSKFQGFVLHANIAQITLRAKGDDMSIQTFSLSQEASAKMQQIVDKGGYQYGDKLTIFYDPATRKAVKFKGKPSKPI
jgi:hypothetical protein